MTSSAVNLTIPDQLISGTQVALNELGYRTLAAYVAYRVRLLKIA